MVPNPSLLPRLLQPMEMSKCLFLLPPLTQLAGPRHRVAEPLGALAGDRAVVPVEARWAGAIAARGTEQERQAEGTAEGKGW